jgi:hypothetical protein
VRAHDDRHALERRLGERRFEQRRRHHEVPDPVRGADDEVLEAVADDGRGHRRGFDRARTGRVNRALLPARTALGAPGRGFNVAGGSPRAPWKLE